MDQKGYIAYLQSLGNQQYYIGGVSELLELEKELNIDLDDYIPYNEDHCRVSALEDILPKEKRYNKKLFFNINSYMRYRLQCLDICTEDLGDCIIPTSSEYFSFSGTEIELKSVLSTFLSNEDVQTFIDNIQSVIKYLDVIQCLGKDEFIEKSFSASQSNKETDYNTINILIGSSNYNINIKALTFVAIALILDIKLTIGFASAILSIIGFNNQAIVRINASEGEKCLILEAKRANKRIIGEDVLAMYNSECIHNDLLCKYRSGDKCTIKKEDIRRILEELCDKNIFKRINSLYKYNF